MPSEVYLLHNEYSDSELSRRCSVQKLFIFEIWFLFNCTIIILLRLIKNVQCG